MPSPTAFRSRAPRRLPVWIAALWLLPAVPAQAAVTPPGFDTERMCAAVLAGSSATDPGMAECEGNEARALVYLRGAYPAVPARVRQRCEQLSRRHSKGFGSYAFIQGCLDMK